MSDATPDSMRTSFCPSCKAANRSSKAAIFSFPVCRVCRHQYWAFIHRSGGLPNAASMTEKQCPFCGDIKDRNLAWGRYRCSKCLKVFAHRSGGRLHRYVHPLSLFFLLPVYLIAFPYLVIQICIRFNHYAFYETLPAFTLILAWLIFRRVDRVA